jgi:superfamily II DNA/RNA helicase
VAVLETSLRKHGFNAAALHGDMDQSARLKTLAAFRANEITYLVASDVAARGLDIPDVSHVFNFDVPIHAEDYVHRIGRTGRAGREGFSFTLVSSPELKYLKAIEQLIKRQIEWADGPTGIQWHQAPPPRLQGDSKPERHREPHKPQKQRNERQPAKPQQPPAAAKRPPAPPARRPAHEPAEPARFNTGNLPAFLARPVRTA